MSTIIFSSHAYYHHHLIIHHLSYIIHHLNAAPLWSLELAPSGWLSLLKVLSFCFGSLFCSTPLAGRSFLLMLFDLSRRLSGQLRFLNDSFLSVFFGQHCSLDGFLLSSLLCQLWSLKGLSCRCSLVSLKRCLVSFAFWMVLSSWCYLISFALLMALCLALFGQIRLMEALSY